MWGSLPPPPLADMPPPRPSARWGLFVACVLGAALVAIVLLPERPPESPLDDFPTRSTVRVVDGFDSRLLVACDPAVKPGRDAFLVLTREQAERHPELARVAVDVQRGTTEKTR